MMSHNLNDQVRLAQHVLNVRAPRPSRLTVAQQNEVMTRLTMRGITQWRCTTQKAHAAAAKDELAKIRRENSGLIRLLEHDRQEISRLTAQQDHIQVDGLTGVAQM